jgi:glycosyltransferase involved in cell wall biosynthesis
VINVHSMFHFVDFGVFFRTVPKLTPVVRTLHDMSFFTGGCHLDAGCGRYAQRCGACPQLGSHDERDLSRQVWERKRSALQAVEPDRLHLVTPSRWLAEAVRRSSLLRRFSVTVIPHGVDHDVFAPRDRRFARDVLGIPQDARVVIFVAEPIDRPVKRLSWLVRALEQIADRAHPLLVTAGGGGADVEVSMPHMHLGDIRNERLLSLAYSAADVIAVPSQQENFPLTVLEALACGVPVVGSAVGGISEIVRDGVTGLLVPPDDVSALATALDELLQSPARRAQLAATSRRLAMEEYSLDVQARRYADLYAQVLRAGRTAGRSHPAAK